MSKIFIISQPEVVAKVGGAISVFSHLSNLIAQDGHRVFGICHSEEKGRPAQLEKDVVFVNLAYEYDDVTKYDVALKRLIDNEKPDLLIFFFHYLYIRAKLGKKFDGIPRILMFHSRPDFYFHAIPKSERKLRKLYHNTVSTILMPEFEHMLPDYIKKGPVCVIPNYVAEAQDYVDYSTETKRIVFLSRIDNLKGVELLIDAFAAVSREIPGWSVDVFGETSSEEYLQKLKDRALSLGIGNTFKFCGVTTTPQKTLASYDICVFPSRFEGFALGLLEAMSVGLPCIGLRSCSGVNGLILDSINGLLCGDEPDMMAMSMKSLMNDAKLREKLGLNAREYAKQFSQSAFQQKWLDLINRATDKQNPSMNISNEFLPIKKLMSL